MSRVLSALLFVGALLCLSQADTLSAQPKQPKVDPKGTKTDPKAGPPDGADAFLGVWKLDSKNLKFDEEITITFENGAWKLIGVYKQGGKEVGKWHGEKIAIVKGTLHYTQVVDEKPPFDLFPNTSGVLTAKDDKGKAEYTSRTEKSTRSWHSDYERTEKLVAVAPMPKVDPKPEPKVEPKVDPKPEPKTEPKTDPKTTEPAGPYSVIATVKGVHNGVLSPDGKTIYALSLELNSKAVIAYDIKKKEVVKRIKVEFPDRIRVSDDGKRLAVADYQNFGKKDYSTKVFVYDTATWETVAEFEHARGASLLAISADGSRVAVGSHGGGPEAPGTINVWDVAKKKALLTVNNTPSYLAMDLSADGKTLVMNGHGTEKAFIGFIDVDTGKEKAAIKGLAEHLAISADGKFAVAAHGIKLTVFDAGKKSAKEQPAPGKGGISQLSLVDSDKRVITGGSTSETFVIEVASGKVEKTFKIEPAKGEKLPKGETEKLFQCAFLRATPNSALLLTVGGDRTARVWTLPFGEKK